jgi:hypothetical protein
MRKFLYRFFLVKHYYMPGIIRVVFWRRTFRDCDCCRVNPSGRDCASCRDVRRIIAESILGLTGRCGLTRSGVLRLPEPPVTLAVPLLGEDSIHRSLEMSHCV